MLRPNLTRSGVYALLLGIAALEPFPGTFGEENTWIGVGSENDMNDPTNWSLSVIPGSGDVAVFDNTLTNINLAPRESTADFSVDSFKFLHQASPFNITFDNHTLTFQGEGITGYHTDTTIFIQNNNNANALGTQLLFNGLESSSGSAQLFITNTGTQSGSTSGQSLNTLGGQVSATHDFFMQDSGVLEIANNGTDFSNGSGGNITCAIGSEQALFNGNLFLGNDALITVSNDATDVSTTSSTANSTSAIVRQFSTEGLFHAGNDLQFTVRNTGFTACTGIGSNLIATTDGAQVQFVGGFTAGDNAMIDIGNDGESHASTIEGNFVGHIFDQQLFIGADFNAGNNLSLTTNNLATEESVSNGGHTTGYIDSESGNTGNQMLFAGAVTVGDNAQITAFDHGIHIGSNALNGCTIGGMHLSQILIDGIFSAGDSLNLKVTNDGESGATGAGGNIVAAMSGPQVQFNSTCQVGDNAGIHLSNTGRYSGRNVNLANNIGSIGNNQLNVNDNFRSEDFLNLTISNAGTYAGSGVGGDFVGCVNGGAQAYFGGSCIVGDHASMTLNNTGSNQGSPTGALNVGSLLGDGQQMTVGECFEAGDNLQLSITNTAQDTSGGVGAGSLVGSIINETSTPHASQLQFNEVCKIGNSSSITLQNSGEYFGSNTVSGNTVGTLSGQQLYAASAFTAENSLNLSISNSANDTSNGHGGNLVGVIENGQQAQFHDICILGSHAGITVRNTSTYTGGNGTITGNQVGAIQDQQLLFNDLFLSGAHLDITVGNTAMIRSNGSNNQVGTIGSNQLQFNNGASLGDSTFIDITNFAVNEGSTGLSNNAGYIGGSQLQVSGEFLSGQNSFIEVANFSVGAPTPLGSKFGYINGSQALFKGNCFLEEGSRCEINNIQGTVAGSQLHFEKGCLLEENAFITVINTGLAQIGGSQILFEEECALEGTSAIVVNNNGGTVGDSQILFQEGFTVLNGVAEILASNLGTVSGFGINVQGNSLGGQANIVLNNASFNVDTTLPTFTIEELNGDATSFVQSKPTLIINTNPSSRAIFNGTIQDFPSVSSSLVKQGRGTQVLGGVNTYTGLTTINEGTLVLIGSVADSVKINRHGVLSGTGTVGRNVINCGAISPGQSIGTLTVLGNLVNNSNGTYFVELDHFGNSDLIDVHGTAKLNGGTVLVNPIDGYILHQPYTIVDAGNVDGKFSRTDSYLLLDPRLSYDANHVYVTLFTGIARAAKTHNQCVVARRLDDIRNPNVNQALLLNTMVHLSPKEARSGLDSLSGYQHTDDALAAQVRGRQFIRRLYDPIRSIVTTEPDCGCNPCDCNRWVSWIEGGGGSSRLHGSKNAHGFHMQNYEVTAGLQRKFLTDWTCGAAGSYTYDRLHYSRYGSGKNNAWLAGLYGLYRPANYYGFIDATYGHSNNKIRRKILVGPLCYTAHSKPEVKQYAFYGESGMDWNLDCLLVQPFVGIETGRFLRDEVKEKGGNGWALAFCKRNRCVTRSRLGLHLTADSICDCAKVSLDAAWNRLLTSPKNSIQGRFIELPGNFDIYGTKFYRNSIDYALTISSNLNGLNGYFEFSGEAWKHSNTFNILVGAEFNW